MLRTTHANGRYLKVDGSGTAVLECLEHVMGVLARICKGKKKKKKTIIKRIDTFVFFFFLLLLQLYKRVKMCFYILFFRCACDDVKE